MSERIVTPSQEDKWFDYIYLGGILIGRIDSQVNGEANVYAYHNDHLGTPLIMTDNNQEVVWAADYEPFGSAWVTTHTVESNIRFPGQYYDDESGMHYNWHRYYQPEFGAYVQADPLSVDGSIYNAIYTYADNSPFIHIDPAGLKIKADMIGARNAIKLLKRNEHIGKYIKEMDNNEKLKVFITKVTNLEDKDMLKYQGGLTSTVNNDNYLLYYIKYNVLIAQQALHKKITLLEIIAHELYHVYEKWKSKNVYQQDEQEALIWQLHAYEQLKSLKKCNK